LEKVFEIEWMAFKHGVFGAPMGVGDTYQAFEDYPKGRRNRV
jgi:hypothetical protein